MKKSSHTFFLRHCLTLAERGRGSTGINPMVGALLVRSGEIIAEGWHSEFGAAHAERDLLNSCPDVRPTDTLYINLEPCCHTNKKTPPCAQMLIERGIRHVVYGMKDPNPAVAGKGIDLLIKNSVQVEGPVLEQECKRLNRGFVSLMAKKRPWITLKCAMTADGKFANPDSSTMKITNSEQDEWSHRFLRARHDAILVGVGTVIADDPELSIRYGDSRPSLWRVILDPLLRIPLAARVIAPSFAERTIIVCTSRIDEQKNRELSKRGVRFVDVPLVDSQEASCSRFDWPSLWEALTTPSSDFHGISSILVEGGPKTWELFRSSLMVDEEVTLCGV